MTTAPVRVAVLGTVMSNTGDAAIHLGTVNALSQAFGQQPQVTIFDTLPQVCSRHYPAFEACPWLYSIIERKTRRGWRRHWTVVLTLIAARFWATPVSPPLRRFLPKQLRHALAELARAHVILAPGGTYLVGHYGQTARLFPFLVALSMHKPVVFYTQSIGPLPQGRDRQLMRFVLSRARLILLRDEKSEEALRELGVNARTKIAADAAFALASNDLEHSESRPPRTRPRVALSVRDWRHFGASSAEEGMQRYLSVIRELCCVLVRRHVAQLTFVSTCQGVPEYAHDDSRIADEVVSALPDDVRGQVEVDHDFHTPEQLMALFRTFDLVISTRMHAAILALCAGVPALAIAYEFKSTELFARLGIRDRVFDIEKVTAEDLRAAAAAVFAAPSPAETMLWSRVARERDLARKSGACVKAVLDDPQ